MKETGADQFRSAPVLYFIKFKLMKNKELLQYGFSFDYNPHFSCAPQLVQVLHPPNSSTVP